MLLDQKTSSEGAVKFERSPVLLLFQVGGVTSQLLFSVKVGQCHLVTMTNLFVPTKKCDLDILICGTYPK